MKYDCYSMAAVRILEVIGKKGTITDEWIDKVSSIIKDECVEKQTKEEKEKQAN